MNDFQRARGNMNGTVPLRTVAQARMDVAYEQALGREVIAALLRRLTEDEWRALVKRGMGE